MGLFDGTDNGRGSSLFPLIANTAFLVAIGCIATGLLLERLTTGPDAPLVALLSPRPAAPQMTAANLRRTTIPGVEDLDDTPTASLRHPLQINPCAPAH